MLFLADLDAIHVTAVCKTDDVDVESRKNNPPEPVERTSELDQTELLRQNRQQAAMWLELFLTQGN